MKIEEITLKNFRSYREAQSFVELSDVNSFIGPNGAGKSNVFEALKFIKGLLGGSMTRPFIEMAFDRNPKSSIEISFRFALSDLERGKILFRLFDLNKRVKFEDLKNSPFLMKINYSFSITENFLKNEELTTPNIKTGEYVILRKTQAHPKGNITLETVDLDAAFNQIATVQNLTAKPHKVDTGGQGINLLNYIHLSNSTTILLNTLQQFISSWEWFGPNRNVIGRMESGEDQKISSTGNNLTKFMNTMLSNSPTRFVNRSKEVTKILTNIQEILAPLKGKQATVTLREEGLKTPTEVNNVSKGCMQILILVMGLINKKSDSVVMVEEPELNLHASAQRGLFELIKELGKDKQIFLTTHSTIFSGCDDTTSTYLVTKSDGATRVVKIGESEDLKIAKHVLGHRNIDLFGYECVVFIEGDSEQTAFPIIAESLGYDFCRKGIRLVNVKGAGKFKIIGEYLRYLKDSEVTSYVIADGNKRVKEHLEDWQRKGIIRDKNWTVWQLEFEDIFSLNLIAEAVNEMIEEQGAKLKVTVEQIKEDKKDGKSVVLTLKKLLRDNGLELNKPSLAEKLALLLSKEIGKDGHSPTPIENEINKIVELVDKKYQKTE